MFGNVSDKAREEARKSLGKGTIEGDELREEKSSSTSSSHLCLTLIGLILITVLNAVLLVIAIYFAYAVNNDCQKLVNWAYNGGSRSGAFVEALEHLSLAFWLSQPGVTTTFTDQATQLAQASLGFTLTELLNRLIMSGDENVPSVTGFDSKLDEIQTKQPCESDLKQYNFHDMYRCSSLATMMNYVKTASTEAMANLQSGQDATEKYLHLIHMGCQHLFDGLNAAFDRLYDSAVEKISMFQTELLIILVVGIILSIFVLGMTIFTANSWGKLFDMAMKLMRRLPPTVVVTNQELQDFLLNRKNTKEGSSKSTLSRIIHEADHPILFVSKNGVIDHVNSSLTTLLGYTPEQLLGQQLSALIVDEEKEKISTQLKLIVSGQAAPTFEDHVTTLTDDDSKVQCTITIVGMHNEDSTDISSVVVILRDETELQMQQEAAEKAKAKSEDLLYHILPRDIVIKLNQGEKDISFMVPSASIMFIDIQKFSEYAATLTPEEIMGNLSFIFDSFDSILEKYPLLTKIKLIGDVYMCAAGLFAADAPPQSHAEQILKFGLDCLQELEDINMKLNSNLCVRIGMNTGGPLIAGVLGTDKPVFDIIGDPINVAARLQSTDIPGKIQIPETTFELVNGLDFCIEKRGEVFLKGKGKTMAYFVNPLNTFFTATAGSMSNIPANLALPPQSPIQPPPPAQA